MRKKRRHEVSSDENNRMDNALCHSSRHIRMFDDSVPRYPSDKQILTDGEAFSLVAIYIYISVKNSCASLESTLHHQ
jgi:hypothetical protein